MNNNNVTTHSEEIKKQFLLNSKDQVCSYVNLNFPLEEISEKYSILGIISSTANSFEGILIDKDKFGTHKRHEDDLIAINILLKREHFDCVFKTLDTWKKNNRIGMLTINTV